LLKITKFKGGPKEGIPLGIRGFGSRIYPIIPDKVVAQRSPKYGEKDDDQ